MSLVLGIHDLEVATAHHVLELADLAVARSVEPDKFRLGLGQDQMSVPAPDEDVVTMGASAARALLDRTGTEGIRTILFATESGVDQSKSAAVYAHRLLGLGPEVRAVELKQACYGGTAALQAAFGIVARHPSERVLVIAGDVAKYDLHSPGEATQGAAAVALLVSADPDLLEIEPESGVHTADVDDFWRPNDSATARVDGALSTATYLRTLTSAWDDLQRRRGLPASAIRAFAYHEPFTRMSAKAQDRLAQHVGLPLDAIALAISSSYNRRLGNSYTASLYIALASLLDSDLDLQDQRLGLFSYGSGSVGELFTGIVRGSGSGRDRLHAALDARAPLDVATYERLHSASVSSREDVDMPRVTTAPFRFAGIRGGARRYELTR